jgi:hypothetical protein
LDARYWPLCSDAAAPVPKALFAAGRRVGGFEPLVKIFELAARVSGHVLPLPAKITDLLQWTQISDRNDRSYGVEVITVMAFSSTHALLWPRKHLEHLFSVSIVGPPSSFISGIQMHRRFYVLSSR